MPPWKDTILPYVRNNTSGLGTPGPYVPPNIVNPQLGSSGLSRPPAITTPSSGSGLSAQSLGKSLIGGLTTLAAAIPKALSTRNTTDFTKYFSGGSGSNNPQAPVPSFTDTLQASLGIDPVQGKLLNTLTEQRKKLSEDKSIDDSIKQVYLGLIDAKIATITDSLTPKDDTQSLAGNEWVKEVNRLALEKQQALQGLAAKYGSQMDSILDNSQVSDRYKTQYRNLNAIQAKRLETQAAATGPDDILKYLMSLQGFIPGTQPAVSTANNPLGFLG